MGANGQAGRVLPWWQAVARRLRQERGAELVEFAVVLPLLAMVVVGLSDFGAAWALRDKLSNAARDGARVSVSAPNDTTNPQCRGGSTPCSVQVAASAVVQYLTNAQVNTCSMTPWNTTPKAGANALDPNSNVFTWTYTASGNSCAGTFTLIVNRGMTIVSSGTTVFCTKVTISYPFSWNISHVVKLVDPNAQFLGPNFNLQTTEFMPNLN